MVVVNFIIQNILTQAAITIALIAMLGLLLQRKSFGAVLTGTFKTLLGFQVLSAGSAIIVTALTYFGKIFQHGFHLKGVVPSIEAINGQAMNTLGLGPLLSAVLSAGSLQLRCPRSPNRSFARLPKAMRLRLGTSVRSVTW